ncbi:HNH endonuclease [Chitinolyticbacter albus]|uniref:HNH endonuclease n=1 Tax=Chitinolyticbacter albus TaxID=2961951 RepID=UPI0035712F58
MRKQRSARPNTRTPSRKSPWGTTPSGAADFRPANKAAFGNQNSYGSASKIMTHEKEYTWHHSQHDGKLQLIPKDIHDAVKHTGGAAVCGTRRQYG